MIALERFSHDGALPQINDAQGWLETPGRREIDDPQASLVETATICSGTFPNMWR